MEDKVDVIVSVSPGVRQVFLKAPGTYTPFRGEIISTLRIFRNGHYDTHVVSFEHVKWLAGQPEVLAAKGPVTLTMPEFLGDLPNGIVGPIAGDPPVEEYDEEGKRRVFYASRGADRKHSSRMIKGELRPSRQVTAVVFPDDDGVPLLYTVYGGPCAEREVQDPYLPQDCYQKSVDFWAQHALIWEEKEEK